MMFSCCVVHVRLFRLEAHAELEMYTNHNFYYYMWLVRIVHLELELTRGYM